MRPSIIKFLLTAFLLLIIFGNISFAQDTNSISVLTKTEEIIETVPEEFSSGATITKTEEASQGEIRIEIASEITPTTDVPAKTDAIFDLPLITATADNEMQLISEDLNQENLIAVVESSDDLSKGDYNSDDFFVDLNFTERAEAAEPVEPNATTDSNNVATTSDVSVTSSNDCSSATTNLWDYIYRGHIDYAGDVDWYRGYRSGTNTIRFILIPPYNRDYDIEIYDNCSSSYVRRCAAGTGATENCTATVTDYFYVKVYGYNNAYSSTAPYRIHARKSGTCDIVMGAGYSTKSSYLCDETIRIEDTRIYNYDSTTISYYFYQDLYTAGMNYYDEYASSTYSSLSPGYYAPWWTEFYPPSVGGWPESGTYSARAYIIGWCNGNLYVQSNRTFTYPDVSCTAGTIIGYNGSPSKSSYACNEDIVTQNHRFKNTSNTYTYNYTVYVELRDPNNNVIASYNESGHSLSPGYTRNYNVTIHPETSWPMSGTYTVKVWVSGTFSDGRSATAYSYAYPYVPSAPCSCSITGYNGQPTKSSYACDEVIETQNHVFKNTGNYSLTYTMHTRLLDPDGIQIDSWNDSTSYSLDPGQSTTWVAWYSPPADGWPKLGTYTMKTYATATCTNGENKTAYSYAYPYVPEAPCAGCDIASYDGSPSKSSFKTYEDIVTQNHRFSNTGDYSFTYDLYSYLINPSGTTVSSGSQLGNTLSSGYQHSWDMTSSAPLTGWDRSGTYTMKVKAVGSCSDGTSKTLYSYAYPIVDDTCYAVSSGAWVYQDSSCSNPIITKHEFLNRGNLRLPYNINFYLYDPDNILIGEGSNSYTLDVGYSNTWTVTWSVPADGWKPGVYRAEAAISGTCSNGESTSASNSTNPSIPSSCAPSECNGIIYVNVKDSLGTGLANANVYRDGSYYGTTDSFGNIIVNTTDSDCGNSHSVAIYCAEGTYCNTQSTTINFPDDDDYLNFTCSMCQSTAPKLNVEISASSSYYLNDSVTLNITVRDDSGNLIDGANLSIYDPFTGTIYLRTTSGGYYTYNTTASKTGTYTFSVSTTKSGYQNGSVGITVSVSKFDGRIIVDVDNLKDNPVIGAKVYLDDIYNGDTDDYGKITLSADKGSHSVEVYCPNYDRCAEKNVYVDGTESLYFNCDCDDSDGDWYDDEGEELAGSDPNDPNSTPFTVLTLYLSDIERLTKASKSEILTDVIGSIGELSIDSDGKITIAEVRTSSLGMPISIIFGFSMGFVSGIIGGVYDLLVFLWDSGWYLYENIGNLNKISEDFNNFLNGLPSLFDFEVLQTIWNSYWEDKLHEADQWNTYFTWDNDDKVAFNNSYATGYTGGYIVLAVLGGGGAKGAVSAIKAGAAGETLANIAARISRVVSAIKGIIYEGRLVIKAKKIFSLSDDALRLEATLKDGSKVTKILSGDDIVRIGRAQVLDDVGWAGKSAEEAGEIVMKAGVKSWEVTDIKILTGNLDEVIKYDSRYVLAFAEDGKNVKIWDKVANNVVIENGKIVSRTGNPIKEFDRFALINNEHPLVAEFKHGTYSNFKDTIKVDTLKKGINPIEELYGKKPDVIVGAPKGEVFGVGADPNKMKQALQSIESELGGSVIELPETSSSFKEMGRTLQENFRRLDGR